MQAATFLPSEQATIRERILAYLDRHTVFNLATWGPAGLWASQVLYVNEETTLYFTSLASTRHGNNIEITGRGAGTISDECRTFTEMRGIQLEGTVAKVTDVDERRRVLRAYLSKFPFAAALWHGQSDPDVIAIDPGQHGFYRLRPTRLLFTDHEYAPGRRLELLEP